MTRLRYTIALLVVILVTPIVFLRMLLSWFVENLEWLESRTWKPISVWAKQEHEHNVFG